MEVELAAKGIDMTEEPPVDAKPEGVSDSYNVHTDEGLTGLEWKDGVGNLPGSDLKFRRNEGGDIEVIMEGANKMCDYAGESVLAHSLPEAYENDYLVNFKSEVGSCDAKYPNTTMQLDMPQPHESDVKNVPGNGMNHMQDSFLQSNSFGRNDEFQPPVPVEKPFNRVDSPASLEEQMKIKLESRDSLFTKQSLSQELPEFSWNRYLNEQNAVAIPDHAFLEIREGELFPPPNKFRVGDLLECVDPLHQSLICAVSVVEIKGYRMRLHFEGYSTLHDFWVNADDKFIFPPGFCEKTGRKLQPPKEYDPTNFEWTSYASATGKTLPTEENFRSDLKKCFETNTKFKIGYKLEAVDRQNTDLTCVATVADIIDDRILIHFDGWNHNFDYMCNDTSNYIHPVGTCRSVGKSMAVPHDHRDGENFSWAQYLKETKSEAAPEEIFTPRTGHGFDVGMKLEAVDKRNPILIRVTTVIEKDSHRIKIHFDGWDKQYDYWIDVDSPDLHPAGWCAHTGHSLQPNITADESHLWQSGCPIPGCRGLGHIKGSKFVGHHSEYGCPYSAKNLDSYPIQDRIAPRRGPKPTSLMSRRMVNPAGERDKICGHDNDRKKSISLRRASRNSTCEKDQTDHNVQRSDGGPPEKQRVIEANLEDVWCKEKKGLYYSLYSSSPWSSVPNKQLAVYWEQCTRLLPGVKGIRAPDVCKWSAKDVARFVQKLTGQERYGQLFLNEEIDGEAFLLLTQNDIFKVLKIKLGPTLKIHSAILYARANERK